MKSEFYKQKINIRDELVARIMNSAALIKQPSEYISSYKHVSNFQWVWRYSCLNVTHKKPYKRYEGKTNLYSSIYRVFQEK